MLFEIVQNSNNIKALLAFMTMIFTFPLYKAGNNSLFQHYHVHMGSERLLAQRSISKLFLVLASLHMVLTYQKA